MSNHFEQLKWLSIYLVEQCRKNHYAICEYVGVRHKSFDSLTKVNNDLEKSFKDLQTTYYKRLEKPEQAVKATSDQLNALISAHHIRKDALNQEKENLRRIGADQIFLDKIDEQIEINKNWLVEFQQYISN